MSLSGVFVKNLCRRMADTPWSVPVHRLPQRSVNTAHTMLLAIEIGERESCKAWVASFFTLLYIYSPLSVPAYMLLPYRESDLMELPASGLADSKRCQS